MECREEDGQRIYTVREGGEAIGFVVIDTEVGGRSRGGLRLVSDLSKVELRDAARSMTLKYGYLGLPQGGAKAGVRGDGEAPAEQRQQRLTQFARAIAPLLRDRSFIPEPDLGTRRDDISLLLNSVGVPVKRRDLRDNRSGYYTALTCVTAASAAAEHIGRPLRSSSVGIEGFGKVGSAVGELMARRGAIVVGVSTSRGAIYNPAGLNVARLIELSAKAGSDVVLQYDDAEQIDRATLLELPVDILCPCARHHSIHSDNADRIKARLICPGANNPVSPDAECRLTDRRVLWLPDFVTNCGGVLGGTMEFAAVAPGRIESLIDRHISQRVASLLREADRRQQSPAALAERAALCRFEHIRSRATNKSILGRLFDFGLELHRRGWAPEGLVGTMAPRYFERLLTNQGNSEV